MIFGTVLSYDALQQGAGPILNEFAEPGSESTMLSEASVRAAGQGPPEAIYMPIVDMAARAALRVCELPETRSIFPQEVLARAEFAGHVAVDIAMLAHEAQPSLLLLHYAKDPILSKALDENPRLLRLVSRANDLDSIVFAPFGDAGYVGGGAKRRLDQEGILTDQAAIVGRSRSLLWFAKLRHSNTREVAERVLGGPPYIDPEHYEVTYNESGPDIGFNRTARGHLRGLMLAGSGCPATGVRREVGAELDLLQESWRSINGLLLGPGATVELTSLPEFS